jgi:NADH-quinone oxidoreductase subunit M
MRCYFYFFCGARVREDGHQGIRPRERVSIFALVLILLAGGLFPQPFLASRMRAAQEILELRERSLEGGGSGGPETQ